MGTGKAAGAGTALAALAAAGDPDTAVDGVGNAD